MTLAQLRKRVKFWKYRLDDLGIAHHEFSIKVSDVPDGRDDIWACIDVSETYDSFDIDFSREVLDKDLRDIDRIIIHELCHIPVHRLMRAARRQHDQLSQPTIDLWEKELHDEMESLVERMARTIYAEYER
jgi:hypothetical protein